MAGILNAWRMRSLKSGVGYDPRYWRRWGDEISAGIWWDVWILYWESRRVVGFLWVGI